jgi:hypothetical protein
MLLVPCMHALTRACACAGITSVGDRRVLKRPLKVVFEGEAGVDEGGLRKEFFALLTAALLTVRGWASSCSC